MTRSGWLALASIALAACTPSTIDPTPEQRATSIETSACGHTSSTTGSGVLVADNTIITAAHVVIGATAIRAIVGGEQVDAIVVGLDVTTDLALLQVSAAPATDVELATLNSDDVVTVLGTQSGTVDATVTRRLSMTVDDVRRETRSERSGFELDVSIVRGDSGAGVFDSRDRLVGIVFAVPTERGNATFAVDATEVATLLAAPRQQFRCDAASSLIEPVLAQSSGTADEGS